MIVTVTPNPTIDAWVEIDRLVPDHKLRTRQVALEPGGGGVNVARTLGNLGLESLAVVTAGGRTGALLVERLAAESIAAAVVPVAAETREALMVFDRSTGDEYRFVPAGPELAEAEWRAVLSAAESADGAPDFLVLGGSLQPSVPVAFVRELAAVAGRLGARFVADTSGPALEAAVGAGAFLITPSRRELAELVGAGELGDLEAAARSVVERGVEVVAVSLGPEGALVVTASDAVHVPSHRVEVVSTVAAGDAMVAGTLAGLCRGRPLVDAVRLGVAAGAATCATTESHLCDADDIRALDASLLG